MTTTDSSAVPPQAPARLLRRSRTDRVAAGVAGGLGEYFGLDPVLFRVLFAVSAFFGGAGVLGYVLAWAAIPDEGTQRAAVDGWVAALRRRRIPVWLVAAIAGVILWCVAFSWWAPGPFFPVLVVVVLLVVLFGRRNPAQVPPTSPAPPTAPVPPTSSDEPGSPAASAVSLEKDPVASSAPMPPAPDWVSSARQWIDESKRASRERRRRAFPIRIATLLTLVVTLIVLGIADAASGIRLPVYFWCVGAIVAAGLLVGMVLRRTPWSMAPLLIPALAGMIAFGNSGASLHDGVGQKTWSPTSASELHGSYRLAFGDAVLDLRDLPSLDVPRSVDITLAAGQVEIKLPPTLNATVYGNVRLGQIEIDHRRVASTHGGSIHRVNGYDIEHTVRPPDTATGAPLTITVHQADGNLSVLRH
jgi:phage shock protein PspC (stress-responsive transcriptional regulator)/FtsH-binding integral membrane protein